MNNAGSPCLTFLSFPSEGTRLLNFNVDAQCRPSRSAIMTGRKQSRNLELYDFKQRRLIDAEVTRRAMDFMKRRVKAGKPSRSSMTSAIFSASVRLTCAGRKNSKTPKQPPAIGRLRRQQVRAPCPLTHDFLRANHPRSQ